MPSRHQLLISSIFIFLVAGLINYLLFQPDIFLLQYLNFKIIKLSVHSSLLISFFTNYFSDIMWCAALCMTVVVLNEKESAGPGDIFFILSLPFLSEIAQYFHFAPGTFDWFDVLSYFIVLFIFNKTFSILKFYQYEKN